MKLKSMSIALLLAGILLLSTSAFAYEVGPTSISGNFGQFVAFETHQQRADRYADTCYFTSEGTVCPNLNVVTHARVLAQPRVSTVDTKMEEEDAEDNVRNTESKATETPGRTMVITSITGNPGTFHRWNNRKRERYASQSCYFGAVGGSSGNLICPTNLNYGYDQPQSFRNPEAKLNNLIAVGKEELTSTGGYAVRNSPESDR